MTDSPDLERLAAVVTEALSVRGVSLPEGDAQATQHTLTETIRPAAEVEEAAAKRLLEDPGGLEVVEELGQGGMGVVYAAHEAALGRTVALKTIKGQAAGSGAARSLLREAWVTGRVEHPHVLPVYRLGVDAAGLPQLVLKRVQGTTWWSVMHDAKAIGRRFGASDALDWNVRVLLDVCQALRLAHDRGVVHRDVKPANVMLGAYGEVYLLDWGVAAVVRSPQGAPALLTRGEAVAGTMAYMAPEQFNGEPTTPATDVYLLGATLYEILVGKPPHLRASVKEALASSLASPPTLPASVPRPLTEVVRKAMQRAPADRFPDVGAFERALAAYLERRAAHRSVEQAQARLDELTRRAAALGNGPLEPAVTAELYRLYGEARFGFQRALEQWADSTEAAEGLVAVTERLVDVELARDEPRAAQALLAQLPQPPAALTQRVEQAVAAKAALEQRLARRAAALDPRSGQRPRRVLILLVGAWWVLGQPWTDHLAIPTAPRLAVALAVLVLLAGAVGFFWGRLVSLFNRQMAVAALAAQAAQTLFHLGDLLAKAPLETAARGPFLFRFAVLCVLATGVGRGFLVPAFLNALAVPLVAAWPETVVPITMVANLTLTAVLVQRWWNVAPRAP